MLVKRSEFEKYYNITIISNTDDGLFAVEYEPQLPLEEPKLEHDRYNWRYGDSQEVYIISVTKPKPRNVVRSVIVRRTSANNYLVVYADAKRCASTQAKNYTDVHNFLKQFWTRLDNDY